MYLHDTIVSYLRQLKKSHASIRNFDDQVRNVNEALRKMRLRYEDCQKREDELRFDLKRAQEAKEKARGSLLRYHELLERFEIKNKDLRAKLAA